MRMLYQRVGLIVLVALGLGGCATSDAEPTMISGATVTPVSDLPQDGILTTKVPGQPTATPLADDQIPESLLITNLVPFTHEATGISGLRPDNWTLFDGPNGFQISSHPNAPDGFIGELVQGTPEELAAEIEQSWGELINQRPGAPAPEVLEENLAEDGTGTRLVEIVGPAQGSTKQHDMTMYARIEMTPQGLLRSLVIVPSELFPQEEEFIREMVDSITIK